MIVFKMTLFHSKKILYRFYELETDHQQRKYLFSKRFDGYIDKKNVVFEDKIFDNRLRRIQGAKEDII